jgi:NAD-dependent DNA ligase
VGKSTAIVVEGDKGGKKAKQARELGIHAVDSDEFMEMMKD